MRDVRDLASQETNWLITSRLDNDDCLHRDYIQSVQNEFIPRDGCLISPTKGFTLHYESKKVSKYSTVKPPFLSLIEKKTDLARGIYSQNHSRWEALNANIFALLYAKLFVKKPFKSTIFIKNKVLWIQLYHQENLSNYFYTGFPIFKSIDLTNYGLNYFSQASTFKDIPNYFHYNNLFSIKGLLLNLFI
jgi:hypothetical protein